MDFEVEVEKDGFEAIESAKCSLTKAGMLLTIRFQEKNSEFSYSTKSSRDELEFRFYPHNSDDPGFVAHDETRIKLDSLAVKWIKWFLPVRFTMREGSDFMILFVPRDELMTKDWNEDWK